MTFNQLIASGLATTALKCSLINAVPVVFFAIWTSTLTEELEEMTPEETAAFDRAAAVRQIRLAYLFTLVGQMLAYLICHEVAQLPHYLGWVAFMMGLLAQGHLKFSIEKRVRKLEATPEEHSRATGRALFGLAVNIGVYFMLVQSVGLLTAMAARKLGLAWVTAEDARFVGTLLGIFGALGLVYFSAPLHLRLLLPMRKIDDSKVISLLDQAFWKAGLKPPEYWQLETGGFGHHNAMIVGHPTADGPFRPMLVVSTSLLTRFSPEELNAIILHEVSHQKLRHLSKRFLVSFGALMVAAVLAVGWVYFSLLLLPKAYALLFCMLAFIAPAAAPYLAVRRQIARQEIEADHFAVFELGANIDAFAEALRKVDALNDLSSDRKSPESYLSVTAAHPTTEKRIELLRKEDSRRKQALSNASSGGDGNRSAA